MVSPLVVKKTGVLTTLSEKILKRIWMPLVIFPSIVLQCYCYWRIFTAVQETTNRVPPRADGSARNDSKVSLIATFQLLAFIVCVSPLSFYTIAIGEESGELATPITLAILLVVNNLNSIIDPIVFFVVFRKKWKRSRITFAVRFNGRAVGIIQPNPE